MEEPIISSQYQRDQKKIVEDIEEITAIESNQETTAVFVQGIRMLPSIWFFLFVGILLVTFYCTTTGSKRRPQDDYNRV